MEGKGTRGKGETCEDVAPCYSNILSVNGAAGNFCEGQELFLRRLMPTYDPVMYSLPSTNVSFINVFVSPQISALILSDHAQNTHLPSLPRSNAVFIDDFYLVMQTARLRSHKPLSRAVIWAICTDKSAPAQSQLEPAKPCFKLTKFQSCYIISNLLKTLWNTVYKVLELFCMHIFVHYLWDGLREHVL